MKAPTGDRFRLAAISATAGFVVGAAAMAALVVIGERRGIPATVTGDPVATNQPATETARGESTSKPVEPPPVLAPPVPSPDAGPSLVADPTADLRQRRLEVPVLGTGPDSLRDTFDEKRGSSRKHEAIDILAPMNTPVVAVENGTIAKLFRSDAGGITVYQFDPTTTYVYYYAHLDHYAPGLAEGKRVERGQVIGYVGVTGNAPKDTPHLHFAIYKLTAEKKWWQGTPIDPYEVLK